MARLPDPTHALTDDERASYEHIAAVRGEGAMLEVYHRLFNHPPIAERFGALGEQLRYDGVLPDDVRELLVLHVSRRMRIAYEWGHHVGPAREAGVGEDVIRCLERGDDPPGLGADQRDALTAADAVYEYRAVPDEVHQRLVESFGVRGVIEVAAVVGAYRFMGGMIAAFEVELEPGFPRPAWDSSTDRSV